MEQITKYRTSDGNEWEDREPAEKREQYLYIKSQIKNHFEIINDLQTESDKFQATCNHDHHTVKEYTSSRSCDDMYERYSIPTIETTYTCLICDKSWTKIRDL